MDAYASDFPSNFDCLKCICAIRFYFICWMFSFSEPLICKKKEEICKFYLFTANADVITQ